MNGCRFLTRQPMHDLHDVGTNELHWQEVRAGFSVLLAKTRETSPPSEWCQPLLRSLWQAPVFSSEERRHLMRTQFKKDPHSWAPAARELEHRAHEMCASLAGDAAWDPDRLFALPRAILESVSRTLERRGCQGLGLAEAVCLPFLLYSTDTVYVLRVCGLMRSLRTLRSPGFASVRSCLGEYSGVICALIESAAILRRHVPAEGRLQVLGMQTPRFLAKRQLVFRGLWMPRNFCIADLCRCYSFTSWSLWVFGALSVLDVYRDCVPEECVVPVFLVALRSEIMRLALPTTSLYLAASPDRKPIDKEGRRDKRLPDSNLRPKRSDAGAARGEKEVILPPFSRLVPAAVVPFADLENSQSALGVAEHWNLGSTDRHKIVQELKRASKEATHGRKSLTRKDADRAVLLIITEVSGSWFD